MERCRRRIGSDAVRRQLAAPHHSSKPERDQDGGDDQENQRRLLEPGDKRHRDSRKTPATKSFHALKFNPETKTPSARSVSIMRPIASVLTRPRTALTLTRCMATRTAAHWPNSVAIIAIRPPGWEWRKPTAMLRSPTIGVSINPIGGRRRSAEKARPENPDEAKYHCRVVRKLSQQARPIPGPGGSAAPVRRRRIRFRHHSLPIAG